MSELSKARRRRARILAIEDDDLRLATFRAWLPDDVILVECKSAGQAIGFLSRLEDDDIHGILLDHDLDQQARTESDRSLSGSQVVELISYHVSSDVPILIHSMNDMGAARMITHLSNAGFADVRRVRMAELKKDEFLCWIRHVKDQFAFE